MELIQTLSVSANLLLFAGVALAICFAGTMLSHLADVIGDRTGVGQPLIELISSPLLPASQTRDCGDRETFW